MTVYKIIKYAICNFCSNYINIFLFNFFLFYFAIFTIINTKYIKKNPQIKIGKTGTEKTKQNERNK